MRERFQKYVEGSLQSEDREKIMKIASIVGARPNFIKVAPVSTELRRQFDEVLIHTGQYYDYEMKKIFFDELNIAEPDYHLRAGAGSHGYQVGEMLKRIDYLFCPTETTVENLKKEGIKIGVHLTGDVMVDSLKANIKIAERKSEILDELSLKPNEYYLATLHRAENTDDFNRLRNMVDAFCQIWNLIFYCHPRTEKYLKDFGLWDKLTKKINVIKPVGYLDMLMLEKNAKKILTYSGGVQKEVYT